MTLYSRSTAQQGQVLVLGIVCIALLLVLFNRAFWLGDISAARMRQNSATDMAAYSAGVVQARLLNMLALLNRAYVAHHVASAHLATTASWAQFSQTEAQRFSSANPPASLIGMMFGPAQASAYASSMTVRNAGNSQAMHADLQQAAKKHAEFSNQVFGRVQQNVQQHFHALIEGNARRVLQRNYPATTAMSALALSIQQQPKTVFTQAAAQSFVADWVRTTVQQYAFLQPRHYTAKNRWLVNPQCPQLRHQLRRRGETQLDDRAGWHSGDTLSFHALRANRWIGCYYREYAMGYAWLPGQSEQGPQMAFVDNPPEDFSKQDFWRWVQEVAGWNLLGEESNSLANSYAYKHAQPLQSARLQPALVLATGVSTVQLHLRVEQLSTKPAIHTGSAVAVSYVAPFQVRGQRPTLFMPYWQPALIAEDAVVAARETNL